MNNPSVNCLKLLIYLTLSIHSTLNKLLSDRFVVGQRLGHFRIDPARGVLPTEHPFAARSARDFSVQLGRSVDSCSQRGVLSLRLVLLRGAGSFHQRRTFSRSLHCAAQPRFQMALARQIAAADGCRRRFSRCRFSRQGARPSHQQRNRSANFTFQNGPLGHSRRRMQSSGLYCVLAQSARF